MVATVNRWLEALIMHSENWGMVWFGLIFWGSIINAVAAKWRSAQSHASSWAGSSGIVQMCY